MTREQAKKNLIAFGIEAPTEEQITNYLNQLKTEVDQFREKAGKADELQAELDKISQQGMTDLEKANKAIEDSNNTIAELRRQVNQSEVKGILGAAGLTEEDYKDLINGFITDDIETSRTLATNFVSVLSKQRELAGAKIKEELLKGTPGGNGGEGGADDNKKTEAEKLAESLVTAGNAANIESKSAFDYYSGGK